MKRYIAILEIEDDCEIVGNIEACVEYTYRDNGTCYRTSETIEFKAESEDATQYKGLTANRVFIDETLIYPIKTQISGGYGTISVLYDRIAQSLGLDTDKAHYDCTKIEVSCEIQEQVFSYYKKENISSDTISMWWICYGPKTNDSLQATQVLVQEGWYKHEGE